SRGRTSRTPRVAHRRSSTRARWRSTSSSPCCGRCGKAWRREAARQALRHRIDRTRPGVRRGRYRRCPDHDEAEDEADDHDGGDPTTGTAAATKLVEQDGVFAVVPTVTPDLAASTYLVGQKVPYFGWALSSNFCGNAFGFGFTGCPVPKNATSNAWPLLIAK